jgi:hypothetical protein
MTTPEDTFDWASDVSVALREQPAVAVYQNQYGQVVLRRERSWDEEDDCFIPIAQENVLTVVEAILKCRRHRRCAALSSARRWAVCGLRGR